MYIEVSVIRISGFLFLLPKYSTITVVSSITWEGDTDTGGVFDV